MSTVSGQDLNLAIWSLGAGTESRVSVPVLDIHRCRWGNQTRLSTPAPRAGLRRHRWFIHENGLGVKELVMAASSLSQPLRSGDRVLPSLELASPRAVHQSSIRARGA
jgi:hypothetical protein